MNGIGAMLHQLGGGSEQSVEKYLGRKITKAEFKNDTFTLTFSDGISIDITDQGQSCCEHRYMTCDDEITSLVGQSLKHVIVKETDRRTSDYDCHEVCFLEVQGDKSSITFATHNVHNGYYGGFGLDISERDS